MVNRCSNAFFPLGYQLSIKRYPWDERFPEWGESPFYSVQLEQTIELFRMLEHLYVLIPVFDWKRHDYIGQEDVAKLLAKAGDLLADHPERELITLRHPVNQPGLARQALARLETEEDAAEVEEQGAAEVENASVIDERRQGLHQLRLAAVLAEIRVSGASPVFDLGCGEDKLLLELLAD